MIWKNKWAAVTENQAVEKQQISTEKIFTPSKTIGFYQRVRESKKLTKLYFGNTPDGPEKNFTGTAQSLEWEL